MTFTASGTYSATNAFTVELSNASGTFLATPVSSVSATNNTTTAQTLTLPIPANTPSGTGYKIRVLASDPATTSSGTSASLTIVSNPTVAISPTSTVQPVAATQGTATSFTGTETPAATSREWLYGTTAGNYTTATGVTTTTYSFNPAAAGTYFVVLRSVFAGCGAVTSTPTEVTVSAPAPSLTATPDARNGFTYVLGTGPSTAQNVVLSGSNLAPGNLTVTGSASYEVSTDNASFANTATVPNAAGGTLANSPTVYIRLKAGLPVGSYNNETIAIAGGGTAAPATVAVSGSVTPSTIATGTVAGPVCVGLSGAPLSVPFTTVGTFDASNAFSVELSTAAGTFPGTVLATTGTASPLSATVPAGTPTGTYRVRVVASAPATVGTDNGTNLVVTSYLANEVASATATPGNGQATFAFTAPASCATNVVVTIMAGTAAGGAPVAGGTYAPAGSGSVAFATGTDLGGGQYVVYNGPATGSITVTGLTNGTQYTFAAFTTNGGSTGTTGYSAGATRAVQPALVVALAEVIVPQYISGRTATGTSHNTRLPYVWRATVNNLLPNATYKYYTAARASADPANYAGVGVTLEVQVAGAFLRKATASLNNASSTFVADANGSYTGWFALEPTADDRYKDQAVLYPMVVLNAGDGGNTATYFLPTASSVTALNLNGSTTGGRGVRGNSFGTPSNFVLIYDNVNGTGRPLAGTMLEDDGLTTSSSYPSFYDNYVDATIGAYGLLTASSNANGIRRVEQRTLATGSLVGCVATSATGIWAGAGNTAGASSTPLVLTSGDTPFAAPTLTAVSSTVIVPGQTLTLTGTNFSTSPNATVTFSPGGTVTTATILSSTSLTVTVPAGAGTGTIAVSNSCGASATLATTALPPPGPGVLLMEDDFDYAAGGLLLSHGWTGSTGNSTSTQAGNETATMYPVGAALSLVPTGTSSRARLVKSAAQGNVSRTFPAPGTIGATALYAAAVVNFSALENTGDYFLSFLTNGTTNYRGRVYAAKYPNSNTAGTFVFGLALSGEGQTRATGTLFNTNTPYVLVLKTENSLSTNNQDVVSLYVLPANSDLSQEPTTPLIQLPGGGSLSVLGALVLFQNNSNNPSLYIDGIRVATGWGAAVGNLNFTAANSTATATIAAGNYYNLTVNNGSALTATGAVNVENNLTLTSGALNTSATNLLTLATAATVAPTAAASGATVGYVNGPVARSVPANPANAQYLFPVGKAANGVANYRPLSLRVATQTSATTYRAEQFEGDPGQLGTVPTASNGTTLTRVSRVRSFTVTPLDGNGAVTQPTGFQGRITLSFDTDDRVTNAVNLTLAKRADGNQPWANIGLSSGGISGTSGGNQTGFVTSDTFSSFSDFALASTDANLANNPLPVQLSHFGAQRQADKAVAVQWSTASEKNAERFEVQRSLNAHDFVTVATTQAQGTSSKGTAYAVLDKTAPAAVLYYRLRQVDRDGTVAFSPVVSIAGTGETAKVLLYPNPTSSSLSFIAEAATPYRVLNQVGQVLLQGTTEAGTAKVSVETLPAGLYLLELQTPAGRSVQKFEKQ
ncbi:T9SS type A sorting domain-containing protein [Hymenobacter sp. BT662]|uniref:T9SS type A sorting domain-containing protein n=1 Tax=Hymenobacter ruricola TaxID=2791023 RepID=A0ABS0I8R8_9BACT|nr:T9SS type A sorting domain-containing protein [Hymenobacter ruricola]